MRKRKQWCDGSYRSSPLKGQFCLPRVLLGWRQRKGEKALFNPSLHTSCHATEALPFALLPRTGIFSKNGRFDFASPCFWYLAPRNPSCLLDCPRLPHLVTSPGPSLSWQHSILQTFPLCLPFKLDLPFAPAPWILALNLQTEETFR